MRSNSQLEVQRQSRPLQTPPPPFNPPWHPRFSGLKCKNIITEIVKHYYLLPLRVKILLYLLRNLTSILHVTAQILFLLIPDHRKLLINIAAASFETNWARPAITMWKHSSDLLPSANFTCCLVVSAGQIRTNIQSEGLQNTIRKCANVIPTYWSLFIIPLQCNAWWWDCRISLSLGDQKALIVCSPALNKTITLQTLEQLD